MHRSLRHVDRTRRAVALTTGCLALALTAPASTFAIGGGTDPVASPPVYPGTSTPAAGWKLVGNIRRPAKYNDQYGVSGVLIAPRLVLASAHAAGERGGTFTLPTGESASFVANGVRPGQARVGVTDGTGTADISLQLLDRALPAPAGGFPLMLTDRVTEGLDASLPGYVLWAGRGGTTGGKSLAGWARPGGTPLPGYPRLSVIDGDSGSTGLLYPTASSRPVMPGVNVFASDTQFGNSDVVFGGVPNNVTLGDTLVLGSTSSTRYATVGAWLKAAAKNMSWLSWGLVQPTFATLAEAGISVSALRPAPPESLAIAASTTTSATLTWSHSTETRMPRTGYRVYESTQPGASWTTAGTTLTLTGLQAGAEHRFTIRSYNANGESSDLRGFDGVDHATLTYARPVTGLTVTTAQVDGSTTGDFGGGTPGADYCVEASWLPSVVDAGTTISGYSVILNGEYVADREPSTVGDDGRLRAKRCGLSPSTLQNVGVVPYVNGFEGAPTTASASTPAGPAPGTL